MSKQRAEGVLLRGVGGSYIVDCAGEQVTCRAGGRLRLRELSPVAGDRVVLEREEAGEGTIIELLPRKNGLTRPAAANLDRLCIFVSEAPPVTDPLMADKLTVAALAQHIEPVMLLAKADLARGEPFYEAYRAAGFRTLRVSAVTGEGVAEVRALLSDGVTAFAGNSAVGKSSLLNCILPGLRLRVGELSRIERGRHTTRAASLIALPGGGYVMDTPGFSVLDAFHDARVEREQLQHLFPEIGAFFGRCRFSDCYHRAEPGCAVRAAVEEGALSRTRYDSYLALLAEIESRPSWQ